MRDRINLSKLSEVDLAWAAGIIDGEGSISISKVVLPKRDNFVRYAVVLEVSNTDFGMVEELQRMFGGALSPRNMAGRPNSKPQMKWALGPRASYEAIEAIHPYLRVKQDRAKIAIDFYRLCQTQKYPSIRNERGHIMGRVTLTDEQTAARETLFQELKVLNKRGS